MHIWFYIMVRIFLLLRIIIHFIQNNTCLTYLFDEENWNQSQEVLNAYNKRMFLLNTHSSTALRREGQNIYRLLLSYKGKQISVYLMFENKNM